MNKNKITQIIAILLLSTTMLCAQNTDEGQVLNTDQETFITLSQINNQASRDIVSTTQTVNSVFIQQIGTNNVVLSNIIAASSDIKIFQKGDQNIVELEESGREIEKLISQTGNNNAVVDFSFNPNISTRLELIQEGDNLTFERFGTNELSKNLKFKMTGDSRSIIVRSF
ncbi:hypothetical protein D1816_23090 [Aquimarina sp. AD10]|uniref:Auto-transporter adhesin head GIN domain-containing protein n=1 Tax=Aquimarina aggregata TaxID=1642818 RepID=A0A163AIB8_9FLAO|nr:MULTISPECIES: hypothetical protein [Aquimarina]AXT63108.1 hypothetical protein D1816_23090 [Aquimarina sp. AD10]KZS40565.1 hypothetical protein AWE51_06345 [Aquimarina aggregata]RKM98676.1 hypothetical protein D7033_12115 [Aquimarina sp. AD10]